MSWTRGCIAALAACVLLAPVTGCGDAGAREPDVGLSASPVGEVLDSTDEKGRHYREIDAEGAPAIGIEVQPDADDWDVRLTVRNFRLSPAGTRPVATAGQGTVVLLLDGRPLTRLRTTTYRLPGRLVPRGTHHLTACLHADDLTVWAVDGKPVQSTADITASGPATATPAPPATSGTGDDGR